MTMYQKLEELQKLNKELEEWKRTIISGSANGSGALETLERLITHIVVLKVEIGIKIKI